MESSFYHIPHAKPKRSLFTAFPVPAFLEMRAAALDISDDTLKVLDLERNEGVYTINSYGSYDLPTGAIDSGHINQSEAAQKTLRDAKRGHDLSLVNTSLPEERTYLFTMTVEGESDSSIRENIEFHLAENVPLSPENAVFDYEVFQSYTKKGRVFKDVSVSVVSAEVSSSYTNLLKQAELRPMYMPLEVQAAARAVVPRRDEGVYMVVDFGKTRTGVSVVSNGVTRFTSSVDIGGEYLTNCISKAFEINAQDAEEQKREKGLEDERLREILEEPLTQLVDEIERHAHYWHSRIVEGEEQNKKIASLLLCGGSALLPGLQRFLKEKLSAEVQLANVWVNVPFPPHIVPEITFEESLGYAATVGLAL